MIDSAKVLFIDSDTQLTYSNQLVIADTINNDIKIYLPNLTASFGIGSKLLLIYNIKKPFTPNTVTIIPPKGVFIDNGGSLILTDLNESYSLEFDGYNYRIISHVDNSGVTFITSVANTNSIDLTVTGGILTADLNYQGSSTIDLSVDTSGLKGDIKTNSVIYSLIQQESAVTLLGNPTGALANVSEITLGSGLAFVGTVLVSTGSGGTVTSISTTTPITGGIITTTGTIGIGGLSTIGSANQLVGVNNAGTTWEYKTISTSGTAVVNDVGVTLSTANQTIINLPSASATVRGVLTSTDWGTFNSKGSGSVTTFSFTNNTTFTGVVTNPTTTPNLTLTLVLVDGGTW